MSDIDFDISELEPPFSRATQKDYATREWKAPDQSWHSFECSGWPCTCDDDLEEDEEDEEDADEPEDNP